MTRSLLKKMPMPGIPVAVLGCGNQICMLTREKSKTTEVLKLSWSTNGTDFDPDKKKIVLKTATGRSEKIQQCEEFSLSRTHSSFVLTYIRKGNTKVGDVVVVSKSRDLYEWKVFSELPREGSHRATVAYSKPRETFELYTDGLFIRNRFSRTIAAWKQKPTLICTTRHGYFDEEKIAIMGSTLTAGGILLLYDASLAVGTHTLLQLGGVLFDVHDPKRVIWRSEGPIWQGMIEAKKNSKKIHPAGFALLKDRMFVYWSTEHGDLIVVSLPPLFQEIQELHHPRIFKRFHGNPILTPRNHLEWEKEGTFNPAAFQDTDGIIHLLYRAIGSDGISRVGYARSENGTQFTHRLPHPVFEPTMGFGLPDARTAQGPIGYHPSMYTSGGGWGGAEDPRVVCIDGWLYMTYVAFEGWNSVRIALTSITLEDFRKGKWFWKKPKLISPPGEMNKNWLIFPEKIGGKFAILHTIAPEIGIEYVDNLLDMKGWIKSPRPAGPQPGRKGFWDSKLRGAGAPPLRTSLGWLLLYHAIDGREPHKYKLGAMILDEKDPTKILYRSSHPILSPDMPYENEGKPGVVYASGAVLRGDDLYVYYGGADKVVCVASTPLQKFLEYLVTGKPASYTLDKISIAIA